MRTTNLSHQAIVSVPEPSQVQNDPAENYRDSNTIGTLIDDMS